MLPGNEAGASGEAEGESGPRRSRIWASGQQAFGGHARQAREVGLELGLRARSRSIRHDLKGGIRNACACAYRPDGRNFHIGHQRAGKCAAQLAPGPSAHHRAITTQNETFLSRTEPEPMLAPRGVCFRLPAGANRQIHLARSASVHSIADVQITAHRPGGAHHQDPSDPLGQERAGGLSRRDFSNARERQAQPRSRPVPQGHSPNRCHGLGPLAQRGEFFGQGGENAESSSAGFFRRHGNPGKPSWIVR